MFGIEVGEELFAYGAKASLNLSAALGLIGTRVNDQGTERCRDPRQLRRAIDLRIVNVQTNGHATAVHGVTQAIERGIESLAGIKLGMRDEAAGVIQRGMEKGLHLAATRAPD